MNHATVYSKLMLMRVRWKIFLSEICTRNCFQTLRTRVCFLYPKLLISIVSIENSCLGESRLCSWKMLITDDTYGSHKLKCQIHTHNIYLIVHEICTTINVYGTNSVYLLFSRYAPWISLPKDHKRTHNQTFVSFE